jgi:hypothetical protein
MGLKDTDGMQWEIHWEQGGHEQLRYTHKTCIHPCNTISIMHCTSGDTGSAMCLE